MEYKKIIAIVRARVNSSRLQKKMLLPIIDNRTSLELMLDRVSRIKKIDKIIVATTVNKDDDAIVDLCNRFRYDYFRGSENDVLDRCYKSVLNYLPVDAIVILTGDCVLFDPKIADYIIDYFLNNDYDYVSNNNIPTTYPDGLDVEICSFEALKNMWKNATTKAEKEHMTFYIQKNKDKFKTFNFQYKEDLSAKGWCLDTKEDLEFIKLVYRELYYKYRNFGMDEILKLIEEKPEIEKINSDLRHNVWRDNAIIEDNVDIESS